MEKFDKMVNQYRLFFGLLSTTTIVFGWMNLPRSGLAAAFWSE